jgi:hypothetical protein
VSDPNAKTPKEGSHRPVARIGEPRPPAMTKSGTHPAVVAMRNKLQSITEGEASAVQDLDAKLEQYLQEVKTPVPPPLESPAAAVPGVTPDED